MSEYSVELKGLNKVYSNLLKEDTIALKDINLQIRPGEFISIIGPSGCGKSTLLRIIGNLDKPTSGTIEYRDGADQQMGFVFQDSVLLPWKNVRQNAEFPLVIQKKQTNEKEGKLADCRGSPAAQQDSQGRRGAPRLRYAGDGGYPHGTLAGVSASVFRRYETACVHRPGAFL